MNRAQLMIRRVFISPKKLKAARERAGLTQREAAERAGVPTSTIGRLEAGERNNPTVDVASRIAAALGCAVDDLLGK